MKDLAIYKLQKGKCIFELDRKNAADIVEPARYAYKEWGKDLEDGIDRARDMLCGYISRHARVLAFDPIFIEFIAGGGQLAKDFVHSAVQKMR